VREPVDKNVRGLCKQSSDVGSAGTIRFTWWLRRSDKNLLRFKQAFVRSREKSISRASHDCLQNSLD
jgi:hypothetical protein